MTKPSIMQKIEEMAKEKYGAYGDAEENILCYAEGAKAYASLLAESSQDNQLIELVGTSIGRASVAWSEPNRGIFDSHTCWVLANNIMAMHRDLRAKDLLEIERLTEGRDQWKWEYENACKFATDFEERLVAERERVKILREALEELSCPMGVPLEAMSVPPPESWRIIAKSRNEELQERIEFAREALAAIAEKVGELK